MKTGIVVHGCHLQAKGWESIAWGEPLKGILGRAPRALQLMSLERAGLLYWGTGASEKDGLKESEYTFQYALAHAGELEEFRGFDPYQIEAILKPRSHIDLKAQNTSQEIEGAVAECHKRDIGRLFLVSSPTHISRCLLEAEKLRAAGKLRGIEVCATASDTCYADSVPGDVVIVEPPHRGDRPEAPVHKVAARVNKMGRGADARRFVDELGLYLDTWS
jgi:hypothetical protein